MIILRLWHYKLIPVLPNKMLVSQWRECIAIKRQWEKESLKHRLVSYVMMYNKCVFLNYVELVVSELEKRNFKYNKFYLDEIKRFCLDRNVSDNTFYLEHNQRYLRQCFYNLEEKFDRGIITNDEFNNILKLFETSNIID